MRTRAAGFRSGNCRAGVGVRVGAGGFATSAGRGEGAGGGATRAGEGGVGVRARRACVGDGGGGGGAGSGAGTEVVGGSGTGEVLVPAPVPTVLRASACPETAPRAVRHAREPTTRTRLQARAVRARRALMPQIVCRKFGTPSSNGYDANSFDEIFKP